MLFRIRVAGAVVGVALAATACGGATEKGTTESASSPASSAPWPTPSQITTPTATPTPTVTPLLGLNARPLPLDQNYSNRDLMDQVQLAMGWDKLTSGTRAAACDLVHTYGADVAGATAAGPNTTTSAVDNAPITALEWSIFLKRVC